MLDDKPAGATDKCFDANLAEITNMDCETAFPHFGDARLVAGESLVDNAMACRLKPLNRTAYNATLSDAQWTRLQQAFSAGVCDWSQLPVGSQPSIPWLTYAGGPGGQPLGTPPESHPRAREVRSTAGRR